MEVFVKSQHAIVSLISNIYTDEDLKWYTQPRAVVQLIHLSVTVIPLNELNGTFRCQFKSSRV